MFVSDKPSLRPLTGIAPAISVLLVALLACMPWGLPASAAYVPPFLVLTMVFVWSVRRPGSLPSPVIFALGISVDVLVNSPIGFWAFLFLCAYAWAIFFPGEAGSWRMFLSAFVFVPTVAFAAFLAWLIASAYFARTMAWSPPALGALSAMMFLPFGIYLTRRIERLMLVKAPQPVASGDAP